MKNRPVSVYRLLLLALLVLLPGKGNAAARKQFVWLSDIHFDPLADPKIADRLAEAEVSRWEGILTSWSGQRFPHFGEDTNWPLFASALQDIRRTVPNPEFTMVTGDVLVHHFRERFDKSASLHDDAAFRRFVGKTMEFVGMELKKIAPDKPVFLSIGNNDDECGDYQVQPGGPFLQSTQQIVRDLLKQEDNTHLGDWARLGVYSVPHPTVKHSRIIAINTVLLSARYRNACGNEPGDPGKAMLTWLESELALAEKNQEKVWLMYHIPPGIDGFATFRHNNTVTTFWKPAYAESFDGVMSRYSQTITASFAGHTHTDDFRLVGPPKGLRSLVLMTPGLTPIVNQSPAYRVVQFQSNGELQDQATYYVSNLEAPVWKLEYRFDQTWGMRQLNLKGFEKLYQKIDKSREARDRWALLYSVSHPAGGSITPESFPTLHCASGHTNVSDYQACLSAVTAGAPSGLP